MMRKKWKRLLAFLLAFSMVTGSMMWNGLSVKAATNETAPADGSTEGNPFEK